MKNKIFLKNVPGMRDVLVNKKIAIAGLGGLGSNIAISLVRAGIGNLILADFDKVEESNLNRQHYFLNDIGKYKSKALEKHLKNINKDVNLKLFNEKISSKNAIEVLGSADILIEAFDEAKDKIMLIEVWSKSFPQKPIIIASGIAGYGKTDALKIEKTGNIFFCGDSTSELNLGLCSARVAIVANMQANLAIELLMKEFK